MKFEKERAQTPCEAAPKSIAQQDSSTESRPLYHPLRFVDPVAGWHELAKPARLAQERKRRGRRQSGAVLIGVVIWLNRLALASLALAVVLELLIELTR